MHDTKQVILYLWIRKIHFIKQQNESWDRMILGYVENGPKLTLSQTSPGFYVSAVQVFWKHWEKEKLLVTSNFSFFLGVFYPFWELSAIFIKFEIVVC